MVSHMAADKVQAQGLWSGLEARLGKGVPPGSFSGPFSPGHRAEAPAFLLLGTCPWWQLASLKHTSQEGPREHSGRMASHRLGCDHGGEAPSRGSIGYKVGSRPDSHSGRDHTGRQGSGKPSQKSAQLSNKVIFRHLWLEEFINNRSFLRTLLEEELQEERSDGAEEGCKQDTAVVLLA